MCYLQSKLSLTMLSRRLYASTLFWAAATAALAAPSPRGSTDPADYAPPDILHRDVAVVGGGSSGTYTAVRLQDHGKSVVVVEPQAHLGGHAETWADPATGATVDIGVMIFAPVPVVTDYLARFDVPLVNFSVESDVPTWPVDFTTGRILTDVAAPNATEVATAIQAFAALSQKHPQLQMSFNLTYPVDPELLLPFGEFVAKHNLGAMMQQVLAYQQGFVPLLQISTLYIFKAFNKIQLDVALSGVPFLTTTHHNVQQLYQNIAAALGPDDVLLNSTVLAVQRCRGGDGAEPARLAVQTPTGRKLIIARKVVLAAPPMLSNLEPWDLGPAETALFGRFRASGYYTGLLNNTDIGAVSLVNMGSADRPYHLPALPGSYNVQWNDRVNLTQIYYGSPDAIGGAAARAAVLADIRRYKAANGLPVAPDPDWVTFSDHAPFNMMVSNADIEGRFYEKLFALQGKRGTFYNGAAWLSHDSSALWQFTENYVLPILLASL